MKKRSKQVKYGVIITALVGLFFFGREAYYDIFPSYKEQVRNIIAPLPTEWLKEAKVEAWQPSTDYYPRNYYILSRMTRKEYLALSSSSMASTVEDNVAKQFFNLEGGISFTGWIGGESRLGEEGFMVNTSYSTVYFRYIDGILYAVVMRL